MQRNMMASKPDHAQQPSGPLSTFALATSCEQHSRFVHSPSSDSFKAGCEGLDDDYFLRDLPTQPSTTKHNLDVVQPNGFDFSNVLRGNPYQPPSSPTSPHVPRKLHDYLSRYSSTQSNSNLSYASSTPGSQLDRYLTQTPLTTPGHLDSYQPSSQDFPFYSNAINPRRMSSTQSPLDSLPEDPQWEDDRRTGFYPDLTPTRSFADATKKRTRTEGRSDTISACWNSPLCPNQSARDGTPPNPATCGGGCAPFLFGEEPLPNGINEATLDLPVVSIDQVTMVSRPRAQQRHEQQQQDEQMDQQQDQQMNEQQDQQMIEQQDQQMNEQQDQKQKQPQDPQPNKLKAQRVPKRADTDTKREDQGRPLSKAANSKLKRSPSPGAASAHSVETTNKATRQPHNKVEQKYRDSINNQMEALRKVVPALSESARACIDDADIEDLPIPSRPSKAVILASATAFIKEQTKEKRQLETDNAALRQRVLALQTLRGNKCDDCSLMQRAVGVNLRSGPSMDIWPTSFQ